MKKLALAVILATLASSSFGQTMVTADNPRAILDVAKGFGSATLEKDSEGDPKISGRIDGTKYLILFFGCTNGAHCNNIQFSSGWSDTKVTLSQVNKWNQTKRYGKAYLDSVNDPMLEMDVNLDYGVSRKNLEDTFDYWTKVLRAFKRDVLNQ